MLESITLIFAVRVDTYIVVMVAMILYYGGNALAEVWFKTLKDVQGSDQVKADELEEEECRHRNGDRLPRQPPPRGPPQQAP
ncbi:MAG: hypothetical protein HYS38_07130 [Acidobacteria bacterium]|nr:hypothetical protein [Acidobacteriota bacterium]